MRMRDRDREPEMEPARPEPMLELQKRFQFVSTGEWNSEHTFDFEDGLRLVVSRGSSAFALTVSAGWVQGSEMAFQQVARARAARSERELLAACDDWYAAVEARFRELSGCTGRFELVGVNRVGAPLWKAS